MIPRYLLPFLRDVTLMGSGALALILAVTGVLHPLLVALVLFLVLVASFAFTVFHVLADAYWWELHYRDTEDPREPPRRDDHLHPVA